MTEIWVGTSGYSFKAWKGVFYPAKLPERQFLPYYSQRLSTVELNNTFYRTPTADAIAAWCAAVPETFRFSVKAPQRITHLSRLNGVEEHLRHLTTLVEGFGPKLGVVLFQFPPQFRLQFERLLAFRKTWPATIPTALEFRHPSWNVPEVRTWMREQGLAWVYNDSDSELSSDPQPEGRGELVTAADPPPFSELEACVGGRNAYVRLRRETYSEAQLRNWAESLRAMAADRVFVFFKHEVSGPGYAATLADCLSKAFTPGAG